MPLKEEIGTIAWFNFMATDISKANDYYTKVFGWTLEDFIIPGMDKALLYQASGHSFGNPVALDRSHGLPSHWLPYFTVEDVDSSLALVEKLGGKSCGPAFDIPTVGRTVVVTDPQGAVFHLFTPSQKDHQINIIGGSMGQPCWLELMADDAASLKSFYSELLAWKMEERTMPEGFYFVGKRDQALVAGIMQRPQHSPPIPSAWLPFFMVKDLSAASTRAESLGGEKLIGPLSIENVGSFSLYQDPVKGLSYIFQAEMNP